MDKKIKEALESLDAEFELSDWDDLEKRLDEEDNKKPPFWLMRLMEFGILLLLVITCVNLFSLSPEQETIQTAQQSTNELIKTSEKIILTAQSSVVKGESTVENTTTSTKGMVENTPPSVQQPTASSNSASNVKGEIQNRTKTVTTSTPDVKVIINNNNLSTKCILIKLDTVPLEALDNSTIEEECKPISTPKQKTKKVKVDYQLAIASGGMLTAKSIYGDSRLGGHLGMNLLAILTPRIAVEIGLSYALKQYEYDGGLRKLEGDVLTTTTGRTVEHQTTYINSVIIPANIQYTVRQNNKWRVYLLAGLQGELLLKRNATGTVQSATVNSDGHTLSFEESFSNEAIGSDGVFGGNTLEKSIGIAASFGLGVERRIGDKAYFYIQPAYNSAILATASANKVNTVNLNIGVRFDLK